MNDQEPKNRQNKEKWHMHRKHAYKTVNKEKESDRETKKTSEREKGRKRVREWERKGGKVLNEINIREEEQE